jgi:DNA repair protein RecO (recombination protein O)
MKTKAILLQKQDFKESSFLLKLLTNNQGIIGAIVQGVKKPTSRMQAHFELGNQLEIVLHNRSNTELFLVIDSSLIKYLDYSSLTLNQLLSIQTALEVFSQVMITAADSSDFFSLLDVYLDYIPNVNNNHLLIIWRLLLKLTELLDYPLICHKDNKFLLYPDNDFLRHYDDEFMKVVHKCLNELSCAGTLINQANILDFTSSKMTQFILDWHEYHFGKRLITNALNIYSETIC